MNGEEKIQLYYTHTVNQNPYRVYQSQL